MVAEIAKAFPELSGIVLIPVPGGQKDVYRATHSSGADVALKIIKPSPTAHDRAAREVVAIEKLKTVASSLVGTNTPKILDSGTREIAGQSRYYIIEQFIEGQNFRQVLTGVPIQPLEIVLSLAKALVGACNEYEAVKMVHRDINPRNIMVARDGTFWVIDLGLVRHLDMISVTGDGSYRGVLGTPGYAPIEVLQNDKGEVDVRADLFSTGIVLYEALNGSNPHVAGARDALAIFKRVETVDLPRLTIPGDTSGNLSEFIGTLAQRYPSRRPQTGAEARDWLSTILKEHGM